MWMERRNECFACLERSSETMNRNRVPWVFSVVSLLVALVASMIAVSPRVTAQDPAPDAPIVAVPVDGSLVSEPAVVDPAALEAAVSPAITYQGVLRSGSAAANGTYDFQFSLYNAVSGGTKRGPTLVSENVPVTQGHFTTILNFGNVFGNEALWIAVGVRSGTSTGAFTALNPRQSLTAVPFARYAVSAGSVPAVTALTTRVATLESEVATLRELLAGVTREENGNTLRFSGMNVQIVSGSGATDGTLNGRGNLIIGYNEALDNFLNQSGSHNLVVGRVHSFSSWGGVIFGENNYTSAPSASVLGGSSNDAYAELSTVVGGAGNSTNGKWSVISSGQFNTTLGEYSSVLSGTANVANGPRVTTAGGYEVINTRSHSWGGNNYEPFGENYPLP